MQQLQLLSQCPCLPMQHAPSGVALLLHRSRPRPLTLRLQLLCLCSRLLPCCPIRAHRLPRLAATNSRSRGSSCKLYTLRLLQMVYFLNRRWPLGIMPGLLVLRPSALREARLPRKRRPRSDVAVGALRRRRRRQASRQASDRRVADALVKFEAGVACGEARARCCGSSCRGVLHAARLATAARGAPRQGRIGP